MSALFLAASPLYGNHPAGRLLWVSGESVMGRGEYWRLATALFTHVDMAHLLSNAFMFIVFGWLLKAYYGWKVFPLGVLFLGAATNLVTVYLYPPGVRLLGASGMVYAMSSLWLVLYLRYATGYYFPVRFVRVLGFILVMLIPSTFEPRVSYLSHAAGFLLGALFGLAILPFARPGDPS